MSLDPIYNWLDTTWASHFLQGSTYTFPIIEAIHLIDTYVQTACAALHDRRGKARPPREG